MSGICWCDTSQAVISALIYDGYDNVNYGLINFLPLTTCSLDVSGCSATVGIQNASFNDPSSEPFPNPFTTSTNIQFTLAHTSQTSLQIFDMNGTQIKILLQNKILNAGTPSVNFSAEDNPAGAYYYVLRSNEKNEVGKMALLR